ncbi:right-handed parallel beta-helix repeat-containing protein [Dysgonomonas termitidis]|uniref:Right-handed parallel beta-helix repeat-containing protein n=1 Tax=Dysgonomonas termitidis TaxID=1516126 RepID=A0ABV9L3E7_9BACT
MRFILIAISFLFAGQPVVANPIKEFYISSNGGKPGNTGTIQKPFISLSEAKKAVRAYKEKGKAGKIIVWIRGGTYELTESFELTKEDSGSETCNISYKSYAKERVIITGGRKISPKVIKPVTDYSQKERFIDQTALSKIRVIDLKALGLCDYGQTRITGFRRSYVNPAMELFINGHPFHLARYPNKTMIRIKPEDVIDAGMIDKDFYPGTIRFDKDRTVLWSKASDIFTCGNYKYAWATDQLRVEDIDSDTGEVKFADAHMFGISGENEWNQYYYFNLMEELDDPGEYYIEHEKGLLFFYPFTEVKSTDTIIVSLLEDPLITLKDASYIEFKDISFEAGRGIGIYMENTESNKIENCTIRNMGIVAVSIGKGSKPATIYCHPDEATPFLPKEKLSGGLGSLYDYLYENTTFDRDGGKNNGIINCLIENTGCGGVSIGGGNRLALEKAGNYVYNCEFTNCGRLDYSYKSPVNMDGVGNKIQHCQFNTCQATAIYIHGNDHIIEYNVIDGACKFMDDQGAVYLGRDPSELGTIIRYNFLKNIGNIGITMGVYFDDGACGTQLYGNVFYKAGTRNVLIGGGQYNKVENNIFIDSEMAIHLDNRLESWAKNCLLPNGIFEIRLNAVNYQKEPFAKAYPEMIHYFEDSPATPKHNAIQNNVFVRMKLIHSGEKEWGPVLDQNLITDQNIGFASEENLDFSLKSNSVVFKKLPEFKAIPFNKIGRIKKK